MPVIYLRHPVHGSKIASMDMEATADEANGWKRYDPNEAVAPAVQPVVEEPVVEEPVVEEPVVEPQAEPVAPAPLPDTIHNAMEPRRRGRPRKE